MTARIPEGFALVPRQSGQNVAADLFEAVEDVDGDPIVDVRTSSRGYIVRQEVADRYQQNYARDVEEEDDSAEDDSTGDDSTGDDSSGDDSTGALGDEVALEPLPVTADSSHQEIDDYAGTLDPKVEFPANTNRADKIALLEEARKPKSDDTAE